MFSRFFRIPSCESSFFKVFFLEPEALGSIRLRFEFYVSIPVAVQEQYRFFRYSPGSRKGNISSSGLETTVPSGSFCEADFGANT